MAQVPHFPGVRPRWGVDPAKITSEEENSEEERHSSQWSCSPMLGTARQLDGTAADLGHLKIEFIYSHSFLLFRLTQSRWRTTEKWKVTHLIEPSNPAELRNYSYSGNIISHECWQNTSKVKSIPNSYWHFCDFMSPTCATHPRVTCFLWNINSLLLLTLFPLSLLLIWK